MSQIRKEARALGITQAEYLRLTLALSSALRESLRDSQLDARSLLALVESPVFSMLLQGIGKTALDAVQSDNDSSTNDSSENEHDNEQRVNGPVQEGQNPRYHPQQSPYYASPYPLQPLPHLRRMPQMPRTPEHHQRQPVATSPSNEATQEQIPLWYRRPI